MSSLMPYRILKAAAVASKRRAPKIAVLIPAFNEELVLETTIQSMLAAGQKRHNIFVADDSSSDQTATIARRLLGDKNVVSLKRGGKAMALYKAAGYFNLAKRYTWIHIADADGLYRPDYFKVLRNKLNNKYAAATGYIRSMGGSIASQYRHFEYAWAMEIVRRFQALFDLIVIIPGPSSCFRAKTFRQLIFDNGSLTEDFDMTMQIHRRNLGSVQYIPDAVVYTQDPRTIRDYHNQILRWSRGLFQVINIHRIGFMAKRQDAYFLYMILQQTFVAGLMLVAAPLFGLITGQWALLAGLFVLDVAIYFFAILGSAFIVGKPWIILNFPFFYLLRWINVVVFFRAFIEISVLQRFRKPSRGWTTSDRRYASLKS